MPADTNGATLQLVGPSALAAFQQVTDDIFACAQPAGAAPADFRIEMSAWHLGTLMLGAIRASALCFNRSASLVTSSGMDHFLVQLYTEGGFSGHADQREIVVKAGDICVFDLARSLHTTADAFSNLTLLVPRPYLESAFDSVSGLHGMVLDGREPLTELLSEHLRALAARLPRLGTGHAATLAARGTVALIAAVLPGATPNAAPGAAPRSPSPARRAMQYIDQHIADSTLDTEAIAAALSISRASLYRLFEPLGGVAVYIRRRRLTCAALYLAAPESRHERISTIAYRWGFSSEAAFSRSFRAQFGVSPKEARERADRIWAAHAWESSDVEPIRNFVTWMKTLRD